MKEFNILTKKEKLMIEESEKSGIAFQNSSSKEIDKFLKSI